MKKRLAGWVALGGAVIACASLALTRPAIAEQGGGPIGPNKLRFDAFVCSSPGGCNDIFSGPANVAGFKLIALDAGAECALYNALTVPATLIGLKEEQREDTDN